MGPGAVRPQISLPSAGTDLPCKDPCSGWGPCFSPQQTAGPPQPLPQAPQAPQGSGGATEQHSRPPPRSGQMPLSLSPGRGHHNFGTLCVSPLPKAC